MSESLDVIVADTTVIDGTGGPAFSADIGIRAGRIVAVGDVEAPSSRKIDGSGLVTSPGFVDPHSHADIGLLEYPLCENLVMQGVTTVIGGHCGDTMGPVGDQSLGQWLQRVERIGVSVNYAPLAGHSTIRRAVMGDDFKRNATAAEVHAMKPHVWEAIKSGAFGMSTGMDYEGQYADVSGEIVELLKIVQAAGGIYATHTRNHDYNWPVDDPKDYGYGRSYWPKEDAWIGRYHGLLEAVEIAREANNIPLHIGHFTPAYTILQPHPDFLEEAVARATLQEIVDVPREKGLRVTFDVIACPFTSGRQAPIIESFLTPETDTRQRCRVPQWLRGQRESELVESLRFPEFRDRVRDLIFSGLFKFEMALPRTDSYWVDCFQVIRCRNREFVGKTIGQIARSRNPTHVMQAVHLDAIDVVFDILSEDPAATWAFVLDKRESLPALSTFLRHPAGMPSTDVGADPARPTGDAWRKAPFVYGLFPYYLRTFVKELGTLSLEEAIHRAAYLPAQVVLGLSDRGVIRPGAWADLVVFDPERVRMAGDFLEPNKPPEGIEFVVVNGCLVHEGKAHTGARPGHVLRRG